MNYILVAIAFVPTVIGLYWLYKFCVWVLGVWR